MVQSCVYFKLDLQMIAREKVGFIRTIVTPENVKGSMVADISMPIVSWRKQIVKEDVVSLFYGWLCVCVYVCFT